MKTIRTNTFETNSSSTHSITISKYQKPREDDIPRNLTRDTGKLFSVAEYGDCGGGDEEYACDTLRTETEKLSFIINMIASVVEDTHYDMWDYDKRNESGYNEKIFNQMIKTDLFVWLQEAVLEETGTMIDYVKPNNNRFPFYETTYDECVGIEELLQVSDKEKFKNKIKEIIFDKDVFIDNEVCPYGMERLGA